MKTELKEQIIAAMEAYLSEHKMSQNDICEQAGVNPRYIGAMRKGLYTVKEAGKDITIADKYYQRLASFIGFETENNYWKVIDTPQLRGILATLQDAKDTGETAVVIGETGCGKTYALDLFAKKFPLEVYTLKVGAADNLSDLINKFLDAIHVESSYKSKSARLRLISEKLKELAESGKDITVVWDESEYMKVPALCAFKELYDLLDKWCALVLIGTRQLVDNLEKLRKRNKPGIPQLYRRIRYRIRVLPTIDRSFKGFLNGIEPGLKKWLQKNCDNYGELHDVLVPARREAERTNQELNEDFVKMTLGILA